MAVAAAVRRFSPPREASRYSGYLIAVVMVVAMELAAFAVHENAFQVLVSGLTFGSLYAIVALGYTMVYGIIELINFAHGDVFAVGAYASLTLMEKMDPNMADNTFQYSGTQHADVLGLHFALPGTLLAIWTIAIAMLFAAFVCGVLGVLVERLAYRPLRNAPRLAPLITAIGVSFIIENVLLQWRGGALLSYPSIVPLVHYTAFGAEFANVDVIALVVAIVMMLALDRFVNGSKMGKAMRAVAQDREAALMMGINVNRTIALTFAVGSALAGAGAVIYGIDIPQIGNNMGFTLGLYAFTAAVLGGIGNIRGAMVGGLIIGVVQEFISLMGNGAGSSWYDPVVFAMLVLVLVFRPSGLLGTQVPEKV